MRRAIGKMRHRIEVYEPARTPDGSGGFTRSNAKFLECWAEVKPLNAKEKLKYMALQQETTHPVMIRYHELVTQGKFFKYDGRDFYINSVTRRGERNEFLELLAREGGPV